MAGHLHAVRWGVLGAGWIADRAMASAIRTAAGARLHAVAARDGDRAAAFAARHGAATSYGDYAALLDDPDVDAVYVALANDAHLPWTLAALAAGKHVLCEKPLGLTADEVAQMDTAATAAGRLLVEASWYRWHPRVRLAQRLLAEGAIGSVRHVSAGFTFAIADDASYRLDPARGGGAMYDVGCYAVSAALWAFAGAAPREVSAQAEIGPSGVDLAMDAILSFDSGEAQVRVSIHEQGRQWLVLRGDAGEMELPDAPYTSWVDSPSELWVSDGSGTARHPVAAADPYRLMVEEVSSAVTGGPGWVLPLAESHRCAQVLDAAFESAAAGVPVAL
ncbi:MAG TPA: Gfo/Idh/MocA family oxidoreductase [Mycobacteriales bacterium]|nr:Gfo/Idh/MocA family oxidoreductase [Mycobacteriales bacterium]